MEEKAGRPNKALNLPFPWKSELTTITATIRKMGLGLLRFGLDGGVPLVKHQQILEITDGKHPICLTFWKNRPMSKGFSSEKHALCLHT